MGIEIGGIDPTKRAFSFFEEFKNFAFKGNVIDMAVGVVIGGAFGKIVSSMVDNVFMPFVGAIISTGGDLKKDEKGNPIPVEWIHNFEVPLNNTKIPVGIFLSDVITFLILGLILFVFIVKFVGWIMKAKKEVAAAAPPPPPADVVLLTEIRDLLKAKA